MTFFIGTPYTKGAGYYIGDKNLRSRQQGDVQTCSHCQHALIMQQWKYNGAWCNKCMHPICNEGECARQTALFGCVPFMKKFDLFVEEQAKLAKVLNEVGPDEPVPQSLIITGSR